MVEVTRQLRVEFSSEEIKGLLAERAKALVLSRKEIPCVELTQVEDVGSAATVVLIVGNKPIEIPLRDKLINARAALLDEVQSLTDQIEGRNPINGEPRSVRSRAKKKR